MHQRHFARGVRIDVDFNPAQETTGYHFLH